MTVASQVESKECPFVPTVANLDKKKFSGIWYSIHESSDPRIPCIHYDIQPASYGLSIRFLPFGIDTKAIQKDQSNISLGFRNEINFEKINGGNFTIFDTDYGEFVFVSFAVTTNSSSTFRQLRWSIHLQENWLNLVPLSDIVVKNS